jgi:hypothetical protein
MVLRSVNVPAVRDKTVGRAKLVRPLGGVAKSTPSGFNTVYARATFAFIPPRLAGDGR